MSILRNKGLLIATVVYWFLLLYIVAALVWWFIALQQQNRQMTNYRLAELRAGPAYAGKLNRITKDYQLKSARNIGEGGSFLLVIIIGAVLIYRIVRRQFRVSQQQQNFIMAITHELKHPSPLPSSTWRRCKNTSSTMANGKSCWPLPWKKQSA